MNNSYSSSISRLNRDIIISDAGIFLRHNHDNVLLPSPMDRGYDLVALKEYFTVPEEIHAESCPACDDMAAGTTSLSNKYPYGWTLVSCQRHATILNSVTDNIRFVGAKFENSRAAAIRYYKRRNSQKDQTSSAATESTECAICLESKPFIKIECGHTFCSPCITHWAEEQTDQDLADWFEDCPDVLTQYPILKHHAKSRYTCPMCRQHGQHTKQSRRGKKAWNNIARDMSPVMSARGMRGGQRWRMRERDAERQVAEAAMAELPCGPASMPVVSRASRR